MGSPTVTQNNYSVLLIEDQVIADELIGANKKKKTGSQEEPLIDNEQAEE